MRHIKKRKNAGTGGTGTTGNIMIIANVDIETDVSDKRYLPIIEKFEGIYPIKQEQGQKNIMLGEDPVSSVPTIEASVNESTSNIEYILGIDKIAVREDVWPHKLVRKENYNPMGHANSLDSYPEVGIEENEILYFRGNVVDERERKELADLIRKNDIL